MAGIDRVKYPSLPSNYVTIAELKERWLKEKERKQQEEKEKRENEEKKKYPLLQNHQNRIANGCTHSRAPVGKNLQKRENHSGKGWREVGLISKEPNSKEVKTTSPVVEEGVDGRKGKEKMGYFGDRKPRVERDMVKVSTIDVAEEEMMAVVSVENGGQESSKSKCNKEVEEVASVCMVEVVGESNVDGEIAGKKCRVGFRGKKNSWRKMGDRIGEVSDKADSVEQSGQKHNAGKEVVSVDVKGRTNEKVRVGGAFHAYGDKDVASYDVEVVGENKVDREIAGKNCGVGHNGKKNSWRKMGDRVGEVSDEAGRMEQSGQERNAGKEKVSVNVKERTSKKVTLSGAFCAYGDNEVASVCWVEVVGENKVDREMTGRNYGVGFRGKKNGGRKMGVRVGEVSVKVYSGEPSGQELNAEKEKVSVDVKERTAEKVRVGGAYGDKEVASVDVEVVGENKVGREIAGQNCGVGYRGKKNSWRKMGDRVGEVSNKADSVEQSRQKHNAGKEVVSVDVKERTNEKVRVRGAFHAYGDKEVASICTVEVVGENKVDREIAGQYCGVGYRGKKNSGKQMVDRVGEVRDKADSAEQSGQECNAEKEKVSVDVKERTNEKVTVSGAFCAYSDKEVEEMATVCTVEVVEENKVDRDITGQKHRVGFRGKKNGGRKMGDRVGELSDKANRVEQSGQEHNAEKGKVSVDVKERTNEKVRVKDALCAYGDKEVEEVATVCTVEVVEENKVDREIAGKKCRVGYRGNKHSRRKMANKVGEVSDKADSVERSGQERNAEKEEVSVDVKEKTNEKARFRGAFHAYSDKSKDVLIDSEAGLKMTIERDLGDLSLTDRRYGHGRSSIRVYGDKWRYGSSGRYEPRKMLTQRDNSFAWIKKGESSNGNVAEIETQVDFSSQSTSRSKLCSQ
ncbi:uncharacterized protein LOC129880613 isoform X2 [Solanum dulcamara]|uniref:uncharacterized protein LOC129880613 isoform X2 n=1 Tax=Solanum dulcamara TaxID=45834 RepID=UPI002485FFA4|nr:uncharacterized protein LOC129880613 isoform X2 [Solanum dulcamara]